MKICYIADASSIHIQRWIKYLCQQNHNVSLISPFKKSNLTSSNLKIYHMPFLVKSPLPYLINMPLSIIKIKKIIDKINPDIVHGHYVMENGFYAALSNFSPVVISAWGSDVYVSPKRSFVEKKIADFTLNKADIITTTSKTMKNYLLENFDIELGRIEQFYWGIDLKIFKNRENQHLREILDIPLDSIVIFSPRTMGSNANIDKLIQAAKIIIKKHRNVYFVFLKGYGQITYLNKLKNLAKKLNIRGNIFFIERLISPREMAEFFNISDIFISIMDTDQFASTILEGMACGAIPVLSNLEVYEEHLSEKHAFFVDQHDEIDIAQKISYCIENLEDIKNEIINKNRKIVEEKEDWRKNARKMEQLYKKLLYKGSYK